MVSAPVKPFSNGRARQQQGWVGGRVVNMGLLLARLVLQLKQTTTACAWLLHAHVTSSCPTMCM
jgi:hypothetical protein